MMKNLFKRILKAVELLENNSQTAFAKKIACQQSTFNGYMNEEGQRKIRLTLLDDILRAYPQVRREWLYFGEGEMLAAADGTLFDGARESEAERPKRVSSELPYPNDALGRIAMLTNIRTSSALELQSAFGADFKEIKKFLSRYWAARQKWEAWRNSGGNEANMPTPPEALPDEWLHHFWTHFGPNPGWIQYGEQPLCQTPLLREIPRVAEQERLHGELLAARRECEELRARLAKASEEDSPHWDKGRDKAVLTPICAHGEILERN